MTGPARWSVGFVGLSPDGALELSATLGVAAVAAEHLGRSASLMVAGACLEHADSISRCRRVEELCHLGATATRARSELASNHRLGDLARAAISSVALHEALAAGNGPPGPRVPRVTSITSVEVDVVVEAAVLHSGTYTVVVQHLDDGTAIVTVRSGAMSGLGVGLGLAGWASVDDHHVTRGGLAEVGALAGAWQERSWTVPDHEVGLLVASVVADEFPGARAVVRTVASTADAAVPEAAEDLIGWAVGTVGKVVPGDGGSAASAAIEIARYQRPEPRHRIAGLQGAGQADITGNVLGRDVEFGAHLTAGVGAGTTAEGDRLVSAHIEADVAAALATLAGGAAVTATATLRDRDGTDDDLDLEVMVDTGTLTRMHLHFDLDDDDEARAARWLVDLATQPHRLTSLEDIGGALLAADLEVTELAENGTTISAGIDLGVLATLGGGFQASHHTLTPISPMAPLTPGA